MNAALGSQVRSFEDVGRPRFGMWWLQLDPLLLLATLGLIGFGSYVVGTATQTDIPGSPDYYLTRQIAYGVVGLLLMLVLARFDYSRLRELKLGVYGAMIGLIFMTLALGTATRGSKRWIDLPFFKLQSSELGKVLLIAALAGFMVDRMRRLSEKETTSRILLLAILPAMLVVIQPDLGSGMVYMAIACAVLFVAGTKWTHFLVIGAVTASIVAGVLIGAPAAGVHVLKQYQVDRLTAFVNPTDDPRRQGYQLRQSQVAIGSGQKTGRGPEHATQTKLDFLPEHHTDFVFSVVGEEFGFMGAALVLSLYALLIWRALRILTMAKNLYGALIAGGVAAMLMFQIFVNVGMTIGIMPITGVPLPLLSYGGSSVIVTFLAVGLLQSIHVQARMSALAKRRELVA
ncbi:MAG: rod shape determining protein RodA [Thermoleophilaceae bacterium]|jgi:rod shape determining protein RodA|nr:rod shape determining protein RodA [Thermoleophilaceae bacterium]MEA2351907.1 rod shape determining protein RodA [Thermoleophilaceae bacterium]MEA2388028.1 rod shape determining protein RodA [Thermoleophilaceae bacterium]